MTDIFGQRHGRKNFFFQHVLDDFETVDRIKYANFQLSYFSIDNRFISWENGERLRLHPDFNHHPFGYRVFFRARKLPPPSPKVPVRLCLTVISMKNNIYTGELPTNTYTFSTVFLMVCLIDKKTIDTFFSSTILPWIERTIDLSLSPLS